MNRSAVSSGQHSIPGLAAPSRYKQCGLTLDDLRLGAEMRSTRAGECRYYSQQPVREQPGEHASGMLDGNCSGVGDHGQPVFLMLRAKQTVGSIQSKRGIGSCA
jgi:hypothetical protein